MSYRVTSNGGDFAAKTQQKLRRSPRTDVTVTPCTIEFL